MPFLKSFELGQKLGFWPIILATMLPVNPGLYRRGFWPSFQQNFDPKEWVNGLGPRAGQRWPKFPKHASFVTSPQEIPPPKTKNVLFVFDYKTCWIRGWTGQVSSSIAWRVIGLQSSARFGAFTGLTGLSWAAENGGPKGCPFLQPPVLPFCAVCRPPFCLLCGPSKIHVFHLETRPARPTISVIQKFLLFCL